MCSMIVAVADVLDDGGGDDGVVVVVVRKAFHFVQTSTGLGGHETCPMKSATTHQSYAKDSNPEGSAL